MTDREQELIEQVQRLEAAVSRLSPYRGGEGSLDRWEELRNPELTAIARERQRQAIKITDSVVYDGQNLGEIRRMVGNLANVNPDELEALRRMSGEVPLCVVQSGFRSVVWPGQEVAVDQNGRVHAGQVMDGLDFVREQARVSHETADRGITESPASLRSRNARAERYKTMET